MPAAPGSAASFFDLIRNQELATRIQVEGLAGTFIDGPGGITAPVLLLGDRDLEDELTPAAIQEDTASSSAPTTAAGGGLTENSTRSARTRPRSRGH